MAATASVWFTSFRLFIRHGILFETEICNAYSIMEEDRVDGTISNLVSLIAEAVSTVAHSRE